MLDALLRSAQPGYRAIPDCDSRRVEGQFYVSDSKGRKFTQCHMIESGIVGTNGGLRWFALSQIHFATSEGLVVSRYLGDHNRDRLCLWLAATWLAEECRESQ